MSGGEPAHKAKGEPAWRGTLTKSGKGNRHGKKKEAYMWNPDSFICSLGGSMYDRMYEPRGCFSGRNCR